MSGERSIDEPLSAERRRRGRLTGWLEGASTPVFVAYAIVASFGAYFCMYAFRKPFAAARFDGEMFLGGEIELKSAIIISQVLGYALSKYIGIRGNSSIADVFATLEVHPLNISRNYDRCTTRGREM